MKKFLIFSFLIGIICLFSISGCAVNYEIKYIIDGEIIKIDNYKNIQNIAVHIPKKDGYTFTGWFTSESMINEFNYDDGLDKNITLYSKWYKSTNIEYFDYTIDENKEISLTKLKYPILDDILVIPQSINDHNVTKINFSYNRDLNDSNFTEIIFPYGLESISENAFKNMENLKKIRIPSTVTMIDRAAFIWTGLEEVVISSKKLTLGGGVFYECNKLNTVIFENDSLESLSGDVFNGCISLKEINLPKSIKIIGYRAFANSGLEKIKIGNNVEVIKSMAFQGTMLKEVYIPKNVKIIEEKVFDKCENLDNVYLEKGINYIQKYNFKEDVNVFFEGSKILFTHDSYWYNDKLVLQYDKIGEKVE